MANRTEFKPIAERMVNADHNFITNVIDRGFSPAQALLIFKTYKKLRVIKLDAVNGNWTVKHGAFWEVDVLKRALSKAG